MNALFGTNTPAPLRDVALLIARVGLGVVLISHGLDKVDAGLGATADGFDAMGIPLPDAAAAFAIVAEVGGGALLALGLLTPVAGLLVVAQMAGAFWFAHRGTEVMSSAGGWELVGVIAFLALVLASTGSGRFSLDRLIADRFAGDRARPAEAAAVAG
ncbi:DoxX family protein [Nocardioides speluncae]|uniref:DoxX family protein n=1 Tax=Nocardioides speluncae TaxID=2670337 RepID=UPI000D690296|nr:DoxX family protein [Nocardioides speluncae]